MSFNTHWDVEKYREEYESDEHWELRKKFMVTHKTKFPEDRLVCLAQVFFNVEFLGCRYPEKTMQLVAELSKGVADDHREKQKGKLKRTFVQASDAAGAKVKGINNPACSTDLTVPSESNNHLKPETQSNRAFTNFSPAQDKYDSRDNLPKKILYINFTKEKSEERSIKKGTGPFADIVIFSSRNRNPVATITRTCSLNKVKYAVQTAKSKDGKFKYAILLDDQVLSTAVGNSKKELSISAATLGLKKLTASCYTVEEKFNFTSEGEVLTKDAGAQESKTLDPSDNIGAKIMRLMGWTGNEGLGKNNQGIEKPIEAQHTINHAGLGNSRGNNLNQKFEKIFKEFALGESEHDLVFSTEFTQQERATLERLARTFKLKTKSFGEGDDRHLVVSKAKGDVWEIVEELLTTENLETEKYRLIEPSFLNRYPEKTTGIVTELPYRRADKHRKAENKNKSVVKALVAADVEVKEVKSLACSTDLTQPSQESKHFKPNTFSCSYNNNLSPDQETFSNADFTKEKSTKLNIKKGTGPFADMVVFNGYQNTNPQVTITKTCKVNNARYSMETIKTLNGKFKSEICINGQVLSTAVENYKKASKLSALKLGLQILSASCYTVQEKCKIFPQPITIHDTEPPQNTESIDLPANNVGVKLMKLMGWSGNEGLGKANQGIRTPIALHFNVVRAGLGSTTNSLHKKFSPIFRQFASSESEKDLVISRKFTKEDRKFLQKLAKEYKLKAKYCVSEGETCLVVSNPQKIHGNMWKIVKELLETENMESEKYRLIEPSSFLKRFPEKTEELVVQFSETVADEQGNKETRNKEDKETRSQLMFVKPLKVADTKGKDFIKKKSRKPDITQGSVPIFDIILFRRNEFSEQPVNTLRTICRLNNVQICVQNVKTENGIFNCRVYINQVLLSAATGSTKKRSKTSAAKLGLEILSASCYTVVEKCRFLSGGIIFTKDSNPSDNKTMELPIHNIEVNMTQSMSCSNNQEFVSENEGTETQCQGNIVTKDSDTPKNTSVDLPVDNIGIKLSQSLDSNDKQKFINVNKGTEKQPQGCVLTKDLNTPENTSLDSPANNIEVKMAQLISCSGNQEFVKDNQGIEKYVKMHHNIEHTEPILEHISENDLCRKFAPIFQEYAKSKSEYDLVFSTEFTGVERSVLHTLATQSKLTSKNYGRGQNRHLVVSKPQRNLREIVEELLQSENCETEKYRLIKPLLLNREPEKTMKSEARISKEVADNLREEETGNTTMLVKVSDAVGVEMEDFIKKKSRKPDITQGSVPIFDIILFRHNELSEQPVNTLRTICRLNNVQLCVQNAKTENRIFNCRVYINRVLLSAATGSTKKASKTSAAKLGLEILSASCYTVVEKCRFLSGGIIFTKDSNPSDSKTTELPIHNIEVKMTQSMSCSNNQKFVSENEGTETQCQGNIVTKDSDTSKNKSLDLPVDNIGIKLSQSLDSNDNQKFINVNKGTEKQPQGYVLTKDLNIPENTSLDSPANNIEVKMTQLMSCGGNQELVSQEIEKHVKMHHNIEHTEPILEHISENDLCRKFAPIFQEYAKSKSEYDLVFSTEFTGVERSVLHTLATQSKLTSKNYGRGQNRHLVVSKPQRNLREIVEELLQSENCETEKYCLIKPLLLNREPEKTMKSEAHVSKEVADNHREEETGNTTMLVKVSDAVGAEMEEVRSQVCPSDLMQPSHSNRLSTNDDSSLCAEHGIVSDKDFIKENAIKPDIEQRAVPFADVVIFQSKKVNENPITILVNTCQLNKLKFSQKYTRTEDGQFKCTIFINNQKLSTATARYKKDSRLCAAKLGLEKLSASCYNHKAS